MSLRNKDGRLSEIVAQLLHADFFFLIATYFYQIIQIKGIPRKI